MSDTLTETAPTEDEAASEPVGSVEAPEVVSPVVEASGQDGKSIPVERFNGLMSKFNQTNDALTQERAARLAAEQRNQELETQLVSPPIPEVDVSDTTARLESQVNQLTDMLLAERQGAAKARVLEKYPAVTAFEDLLVAETPEDLEALAADINRRLEGSAPPPAEVAAGEVVPAAVPPVQSAPAVVPPATGGGSGLVDDASASAGDLVADAIKSRSFTSYLAAKQSTGASDGLVLES